MRGVTTAWRARAHGRGRRHRARTWAPEAHGRGRGRRALPAPTPGFFGSMGFRAGLEALAQRIGLAKKKEKEVEEVAEEGLASRSETSIAFIGNAPQNGSAGSAPRHLTPCACHCAACRAAGHGNTCVVLRMGLLRLFHGKSDIVDLVLRHYHRVNGWDTARFDEEIFCVPPVTGRSGGTGWGRATSGTGGTGTRPRHGGAAAATIRL
jgi:hypothetical protein